jgi:hypothetical protein
MAAPRDARPPSSAIDIQAAREFVAGVQANQAASRRNALNSFAAGFLGAGLISYLQSKRVR